MKIVHVIPALTKGGGERVAVELANFAADSGNQVTILAAFPVAPSLLQHLIHPQIEIKFVSKNGRASYLQMLWWIARNLQWLSSFDILHCHLTYGAFFASLTRILRRIRFIKKPCIVETYHAVGMPISSLHRKIHSQLARQRDALVLMAKDEYWQQFILNNKNLLTRIIPNGIN
ncbi:MAG TPA: glycosyltransferase family 4 protein, partial [Flavisolibacter sp.]|nr:glycosyltransferase family 4 protein [Flavisolibacter sp.]